MTLRVDLDSRKDELYLGTIYLGSPKSQPIKVVFDTGSEYLVVTSSFCKDSTTPKKFKFKQYDPINHDFILKQNSSERCLNQAYDVLKSESNFIESKNATQVVYGSAKLKGFNFEDYVCLQPISN